MAKNFVSNKDESARLFKSDALEFFTHVHWSVPIILFLPVVLYCLYVASQSPEIGFGAGLGLFVAGLFIWTLTEYLLHRFVFHYQPSSSLGKQLHFLMHGIHHDYPSDSTRLVMPPAVSIPLALLFFGLFRFLMGPVFVAPFFAGFILGYIAYDTIHYATHHAPMKSAFWLEIKHHHIRHHFHNPEMGYGVSSPMWDHVFRTYDRVEEKSAGAA